MYIRRSQKTIAGTESMTGRGRGEFKVNAKQNRLKSAAPTKVVSKEELGKIFVKYKSMLKDSSSTIFKKNNISSL